MDTHTNDYIITGGEVGKSRLDVLSGVLHKYDEVLLKEQGLIPGMSFLDVGTGGGNVAMLAAKLVGENGRVSAIDFDEKIISLAQQDAVDNGLQNIAFRIMSAYDITYAEEYDIVFARFLLSHLKKPAEALLKMKQSVKPGGRIIVEDVHFDGHFSHPANEAFDNYVHYYTTAAKNKGENANIGPLLPSLFHDAGIEDVGFDIIQPCFNTGPGKQMAYLTLSNIKDTLVDQGVVGLHQVNTMLHELKDFTEDEQTIISLPRIFRVWGTKR